VPLIQLLFTTASNKRLRRAVFWQQSLWSAMLAELQFATRCHGSTRKPRLSRRCVQCAYHTAAAAAADESSARKPAVWSRVPLMLWKSCTPELRVPNVMSWSCKFVITTCELGYVSFLTEFTTKWWRTTIFRVGLNNAETKQRFLSIFSHTKSRNNCRMTRAN